MIRSFTFNTNTSFSKNTNTKKCRHISVNTRRANFAKYLFLGYVLVENEMCCYTKYWESFAGKFNLFSWYFFLLEKRMCFCGILRILSWKFLCALLRFASPENLCVLVLILVLLENLMCSYKRIISSPGKFICFLITSMPPGKFNLF